MKLAQYITAMCLLPVVIIGFVVGLLWMHAKDGFTMARMFLTKE